MNYKPLLVTSIFVINTFLSAQSQKTPHPRKRPFQGQQLDTTREPPHEGQTGIFSTAQGH